MLCGGPSLSAPLWFPFNMSIFNIIKCYKTRRKWSICLSGMFEGADWTTFSAPVSIWGSRTACVCVWDWVTVNRYVCVHRNAEHQRQGFFKIYVLGLGHPRNRRIQTLLVWVFQWDFLVKMCNKENDQTCPWNCRNILFLMFILQRMRSFFLGNQHRGKHLRDLEGTSGLRVFLINTTHVSPFQSSLAPLLLISSDAV